MGIVSGFRDAGLYAKTAFILLVVATFFAYLSFASTGWGESSNGIHYGLWRICRDLAYTPNCTQTDGWAWDWWANTQAFVTLGFVGINVMMLLVSLYVFVKKCHKNDEVAMAAAIIGIVTALLYLVGVVTFGLKFDQYYVKRRDTDPKWPEHWLTYCFGASIGVIGLEIIAAILMILDTKKWETYPVA